CMLAVAGISFYLIPYTPFVSDLTIEAAIWVSIAAVIAICYLWQQVQYFAQKKFKREKSRRIQSQT
ncbi:MAG TPA: hypothetical protein VK074_10440, partial [Fodinibius sp.]|nr:hypothetical protein [Fodinibius sp.]